MRFWGLVRARVVDELTGQPPLSPITVRADLRGCTSRVLTDGVVGLVGMPRHAYPSVAAANYGFDAVIAADGYFERTVRITLPTDPRTVVAPSPNVGDEIITLDAVARLSAGETVIIGAAGPSMAAAQIRALGPGANQIRVAPPVAFAYGPGDPVVPVVPDDFATADLGDLYVHRRPVTIAGRTWLATGGVTSPIGGVAVTLTGVWRQSPPANVTVAASPANLVSVQPALYFDRTPSATLRRREVAIVTGDMALGHDCAAGTSVVRLEHPVSLAVTDLVQIDALDADRVEHIPIQHVAPGATPAHPVQITLAMPLATAHRRGSIARKATLQASGATNPFDQDLTALDPDASVGDVCVLLNSRQDLDQPGPQAFVAEIGGGPVAEYHRFSTFSTTSDATGAFRLPPLSRIAQVEITADRGGGNPVVRRIVSPNYGAAEHRVDFVFS
jgi:hypothetical protein